MDITVQFQEWYNGTHFQSMYITWTPLFNSTSPNSKKDPLEDTNPLFPWQNVGTSSFNTHNEPTLYDHPNKSPHAKRKELELRLGSHSPRPIVPSSNLGFPSFLRPPYGRVRQWPRNGETGWRANLLNNGRESNTYGCSNAVRLVRGPRVRVDWVR